MAKTYRVLWAALFAVACDGGGVAEVDGGLDARAEECAGDLDCDDGAYCNGAERCDDGECAAGVLVDCDDGEPCTMDVCSDARATCEHLAPDRDGDGHDDMECGGDDCADADANRFPGNSEVCDDHDEDCNLTTFGIRDADADGEHDRACCNYADDGSMSTCGGDCDDSNAGAHRLAPEVCGDGADNDCDGLMDEGLVVMRWRDEDGDLHGNPAMPSFGCGSEPGYSTSDGDCHDGDPSIHRGAAETCNSVDDDCDGVLDDSCSGCPPSTADDMWVACTSERCANTSRWVSDCGGCDRPCTNAHGDVSCVGGACAPICASGWDDCNGVARDGCETDVLASMNDCGACGNPCARGETCDRGRCVSCADAGQVDCAGACVPSDVRNCGICRTVCPGDGVCLDLHCVRCSVRNNPEPFEYMTTSDRQAMELRCPNMVPGQTVRITASGNASTTDPGDVVGRFVHFDLTISDGTVRSYRGVGGNFTLTADVVVPASGELAAQFDYVAAGWSGASCGSTCPIRFNQTTTFIEDLP